MRNLDQLNTHLFDQLESLTNKNLTEKQLKTQLAKTKAMTDIAGQIVNSAKLQLEAQKLYNGSPINKPGVFGLEDKS